MTPTASFWVERLGLRRHPEGGWYRETYRAAESVARAHLPGRFTGDRCFATAIYYLLEAGDFSALHRIRQDEGWHFYDGDPLLLHQIDPAGACSRVTLGRDLAAGQVPQAFVPAGWLFAAEVAPGGSCGLVGCTVAPGFDFADFELPARAALLGQHPQHRALVERLTRG
jgi:predicted cupin superfamily sugar epimerase